MRQTRNRIGKVEAQTELRVQSGGTERAGSSKWRHRQSWECDVEAQRELGVQ